MKGYDPPPSYYDPPEKPLQRCPICDEETDKFIVDRYGDVVGCPYCTKEIDSEDE